MSGVSQSAIERVSITKLKPAQRNARRHPERQLKELCESMKRFGVTTPALIDDDDRIIAGHGRIEAAKRIGLAEFPCLRLSHLTDAEKRAYMLADNKIALNATWDKEALAIDLRELSEMQFDVSLTGFSVTEVDLILTEADDARPDGDDPDDSPPSALAGTAVTRSGDIWVLGRHRLICGDAKDSAVVEGLMLGAQADMIFTDPPYNVPIQGHVSGLGKVRHREFAEGVGEMSEDAFEAFLAVTLSAAAAACRDGAIAFVCMDWRHLREVLAAGHCAFTELKNLCVWNKTNGGMGTFYRSQHELVLVWKKGDVPHTNNFGLGDKGRYRTNVWTYAGANAFKTERMEELKLHPTVKPVALVADAIRDVTNRGQVVLDIFGGSGTTLIAAQKTGRSARLIEIDPLYCDGIVRRWEALTGKAAVLEDGGRTFDEMSTARDGWGGASTGWAR